MIQFGNDITDLGEVWVAEPVGVNPEESGLARARGSGWTRWNGYAALTPESGNKKTGKCVNTYAAQASCPDGHNNAAGYRCPFLGSGCYAEKGHVWMNVVSKINRAGEEQRVTPEDVAEAEAQLIREFARSDRWRKIRDSAKAYPVVGGVRFHVVGDCVTEESARIVASALRELYIPLGERWLRNIWGYTRAWRDVPRSVWGDHVSILASCDTADDVRMAVRRGWATTVVVPVKYGQQVARGAKLRVGGVSVVICPFELRKQFSPDDPRSSKPVQCVTCRLCLREPMLVAKGLCVGFCADGSAADRTASGLIRDEDIEITGAVDPEQMHLEPSRGDRDYFDTVDRAGYSSQ